MPTHWMSYVSVTIVDETVEKAESLGATIVSGLSECYSNCVYVTPCYYIYFENGKIVSIYDAVNW